MASDDIEESRLSYLDFKLLDIKIPAAWVLVGRWCGEREGMTGMREKEREVKSWLMAHESRPWGRYGEVEVKWVSFRS